ncbi:MAG: AbrB/MazE/SpoVT family DNA-binding domain-containing protein [Nanoarchaeota archaeon]
MPAETIKMSSRGQIVIPQDIREEIKASEGTIFSVVSAKDAIILKKLSTPSKEELIKELGAIALEGRKRAEKLGIKESDVSKLVQRVRKSKR